MKFFLFISTIHFYFVAQLLRTVSNPDLHQIDHSIKFHRSLSDIDHKLESSDETSKNNRLVREFLRTTTCDQDDDDVWCNPEDEVTWKHMVEMNQQKEEELRNILGDDLLSRVRQTLQVKVKLCSWKEF